MKKELTHYANRIIYVAVGNSGSSQEKKGLA
jgi:hypothetical protein